MGAKRTYRIAAAAAVAVLVAVLLVYGAIAASESAMVGQGAASIRRAVLQAAMQCNAVEGTYPSSLAYLEDHYGLSINHEDYVVFYEAFAGNVAPTVTVTPR